MPSVINSGSEIHDSIIVLRNLIASGTTDPVSASRPAASKWIATSYPDTNVYYPFVVVKHQSSAFMNEWMNSQQVKETMTFQVQVCALDVKTRDEQTDRVVTALRLIQQSGTVGTIAAGLHDMQLISITPVDDPGGRGEHRNIISLSYKYYTV